jgi:hypothetical protein
MNGLNVRITNKVPVIEGPQYSLHVVNPHGGGQTRIVDLNTRHAMRNKKFQQLLMRGQAVG